MGFWDFIDLGLLNKSWTFPPPWKYGTLGFCQLWAQEQKLKKSVHPLPPPPKYGSLTYYKFWTREQELVLTPPPPPLPTQNMGLKRFCPFGQPSENMGLYRFRLRNISWKTCPRPPNLCSKIDIGSVRCFEFGSRFRVQRVFVKRATKHN